MNLTMTWAHEQPRRRRAVGSPKRRAGAGVLSQERAELEEEVRQLRAAIDIYRELVNRLSAGQPRFGSHAA